MKLTRLCKWSGSMGSGQCPALYAADDLTQMVGQGKVPDADTAARLVDVAADEAAVVIPTETVLRAVAKLAVNYGAASLASEVETFLAAHPEVTGS